MHWYCRVEGVPGVTRNRCVICFAYTGRLGRLACTQRPLKSLVPSALLSMALLHTSAIYYASLSICQPGWWDFHPLTSRGCWAAAPLAKRQSAPLSMTCAYSSRGYSAPLSPYSLRYYRYVTVQVGMVGSCVLTPLTASHAVSLRQPMPSYTPCQIEQICVRSVIFLVLALKTPTRFTLSDTRVFPDYCFSACQKEVSPPAALCLAVRLPIVPSDFAQCSHFSR